MALIVEDGTGMSTAESFASVAAADTRLAALGNTNWADLTTTEKEQALRRATAYMEQAYRQNWQGTRVNSTQALSWPRSWATVDGYAVAADSVPAVIANACIDLAFMAAAGDLNPNLERAVIRKKLGPLETEYSPHSPQQVRYRAIDMMLAPYLGRGGASYTLVRS